MAIELQRDAPLFDKLLNIQICQGNAEPRVLALSFRVIPGTRSMAQSGQSERLFHFEVRPSVGRWRATQSSGRARVLAPPP